MPASVVAPDLTPDGVLGLYADIERRLSRHLDGRGDPPLALVDRQLPEDGLARLMSRLRVPGVLDGVDLVLATSGSRSSRPHLVGLSWEAIVASANATRRYLGADGTWWLTLSPHHIAGLQVVVRSVLSGTVPRLSASPPKDVDGPLYGALVPTQLARMPRADLAGFDALLIGGARLDPALRRAAEGLPIVTTYGMTETCGGCVYNGVPLGGTRVRVEDSRVLLGGPTLMARYLDEPSPFIALDGHDWLVTGDLGSLSQGVLQITGRGDDIIVSGGENVSAFAVADAIAVALPDLAAVEVLGIPDAEWGQLVVAAVIPGARDDRPDTSADPLGPRVRAAAAAALGRRAAPRMVVVLPALPLLPGGKVDRRELRRQVLAQVDTRAAWRR